jgi:hypothetical protein
VARSCCSVGVASSKVLLHLSKLLFFSALLQVKQLHFSLKTALLFSQAYVIKLLLLQL